MQPVGCPLTKAERHAARRPKPVAFTYDRAGGEHGTAALDDPSFGPLRRTLVSGGSGGIGALSSAYARGAWVGEVQSRRRPPLRTRHLAPGRKPLRPYASRKPAQ